MREIEGGDWKIDRDWRKERVWGESGREHAF